MPNNSNNENSEPSHVSDLISLQVAARISGLSQGHLSLLIRNGDLWGTKLGGRNWFTTQKAIKVYLDSNPKPGPIPGANPKLKT